MMKKVPFNLMDYINIINAWWLYYNESSIIYNERFKHTHFLSSKNMVVTRVLDKLHPNYVSPCVPLMGMRRIKKG